MENQPIATDSEKTNSNVSPLTIGAMLATIPPVAYLIGYSFYQGYLNEFGVDSDIFPISTQYVYINAYHAVIYVSIRFLSIFIELTKGAISCYSGLIILLTILAMLAVSWYLTNKDDHPAKKIIKRRLSFLVNCKRNNFIKSVGIIWMITSFLFFLMYCLLVFVMLWFPPSYAAYSEGQRIATNRIEMFRKNGCNIDRKTNLNKCASFFTKDENGNNKILHEGLLIAINEKQIALFEKDGTFILPLKDDYILQRKIH